MNDKLLDAKPSNLLLYIYPSLGVASWILINHKVLYFHFFPLNSQRAKLESTKCEKFEVYTGLGWEDSGIWAQVIGIPMAPTADESPKYIHLWSGTTDEQVELFWSTTLITKTWHRWWVFGFVPPLAVAVNCFDYLVYLQEPCPASDLSRALLGAAISDLRLDVDNKGLPWLPIIHGTPPRARDGAAPQ